MTMRKFALVLSLVGILIAAALPAQAGSNGPWTGFYGGVNVGYGWANTSGRDAIYGDDIGSARPDGGIFGGQLGYDCQVAKWVWGAQASLAAADIRGNHPFLDGTGPSNLVSYDVKFLGTLAARIGYVVAPDTLLYVKGGGAMARTNYDDSDPAPQFGGYPPYTGSDELVRLGWLAGLGLEHKVGRDLSLYVEYQHMDFGRADTTIAYTDGFVGVYSFKQRIDAVIFGLNYRFYGLNPSPLR